MSWSIENPPRHTVDDIALDPLLCWPSACSHSIETKPLSATAARETGMAKQIGYAVVGLGDIARKAVIPAFARAAENARLVAIVSGDRAKAQALGQQHRATPYHYDELRQCLERDDVEAVYLTL